MENLKKVDDKWRLFFSFTIFNLQKFAFKKSKPLRLSIYENKQNLFY